MSFSFKRWQALEFEKIYYYKYFCNVQLNKWANQNSACEAKNAAHLYWYVWIKFQSDLHALNILYKLFFVPFLVKRYFLLAFRQRIHSRKQNSRLLSKSFFMGVQISKHKWMQIVYFKLIALISHRFDLWKSGEIFDES